MYNLTKLKKTFDQISYGTSEMAAFEEILDFFLVPFRWHDNGLELNDALGSLRGNSKSILHADFMMEIADLNPEGFADPLGEFYMQHISYGRLGQYFTPEVITDFMAKITVDEHVQDGARFADPACGSGRTLLSAAKINRNLVFYGADLDAICCKMCLVNMLMNSMIGEVANMDSLSNEFFRGYQVKTMLLNGHYYPYFVEFTDSLQSFIYLHPPGKAAARDPGQDEDKSKLVYIQGNLFG